MLKKRILVVFGTRPEAIKLAPVIRVLETSGVLEPIVAVTAQHRRMLDQVLDIFSISTDFDLDLMKPGQSLTDVTTGVLRGLEPVILSARPDALIVQGDTTTTLAGGLAAFYHHVPLIHVEAGYRTSDKAQPFPEEANRRLVSEIADWHFAVNERCRQNLLGEGHDPDRIFVEGNTGIDALMTAARSDRGTLDEPLDRIVETGRRVVLMTMHRRENWGEPLENACRAAREIVERCQDVELVFATHLNPVVRTAAERVLGDTDRVHLVPALDYLSFVKVLVRADLVLSDSGGIHEEAVALGKPLVLLRNVSEWPEAIESGHVKLVGTGREGIAEAASRVLSDIEAGRPLPRLVNPLSDGRAAERVVARLERLMG